jgi:hypothetical protein
MRLPKLRFPGGKSRPGDTAGPTTQSESGNTSNAASENEVALSPLGTLTGVVLHPRATFEKMRQAERGHWWLVFVITVLAVILLAVATTTAQSRMMQGFTPPQGVEMPEGAAASAGAGTNATSGILRVALTLTTGIVGAIVGYLLQTVVILGLGLVLGGKATFRQIFRMAAWTTLPVAIRKLIQAITSLVAGATPASGLSAALTIQEAYSMPMLNTLLSNIDIYTVWSMILLGIGVAVTSKLSKGKSIIAVAVYTVIALAALLALNAAGNAISGLLGGGFGFGMGGPGGRPPG